VSQGLVVMDWLDAISVCTELTCAGCTLFVGSSAVVIQPIATHRGVIVAASKTTLLWREEAFAIMMYPTQCRYTTL